MVTKADLDWWLELAPTLEWTFARTMSDTPHSYVVRGKTLDDAEFLRTVKVIRTFGEPGKFYSSTNIYLVSQEAGHRWWTMGDTLDGTIIINQAPWDQTYGRQNAPRTRSAHWSVYDEIATEYDARYQTAKDQAEERQLMSLLKTLLGPVAPRLLDIGCGTGLLLDHKITHPSFYTGIDPSQAMLNELVRKHPAAVDLYPMTWTEYVRSDTRHPTFDLVTILFGTASYLSPEELARAVELSHGTLVAMHYLPGYLPDYHDGKPPHVDTSREWAAGQTSRVFELGNFQVSVITS